MSRTSSPGGVSSAAAAAGRPWIVSGGWDAVLFIATPLLILPLIQLARRRLTIEEISLYVVAFGAMGHHLPGMIRAYGDPQLFRRFRTRFIVAPIALLAVAGYFSFRDYNGLVLIAVLWAFWHALMQVYGFLRIYDAKSGQSTRWDAWLDFAMCLVWFTSGLVFSSGRMTLMLDGFYKSGGPLVEPAVLRDVRLALGVATAAVSIVFLARLVRQAWNHRVPSFAKLCTLTVSIAFWWYAMLGVENVILGIAMFEIFHDVQYLAIVWIFNRNRADKDPAAGRVTRFLFRRKTAMLALYVGLVFAYGFLGLLPQFVTQKQLNQLLAALYVTSGLLHFYYDGFIWKVRESSTRAALNLDSGGTAAAVRRLPAGLTHALKWTAFAIPVFLLAWAESRGTETKLKRYQNLVKALPDSWSAHHELGIELVNAGQREAAFEHCLAAVRLNPGSAAAQNNLGNQYAQRGEHRLAERHLREAIRLNPQLADAYADLGAICAGRGDLAEAEQHDRRAIALKPEHAIAHNNLGSVLMEQGGNGEAEEHFREAIRLQPDYALAINNLGVALLRLNQPQAAAEMFQEAMNRQPRYFEAALNRGIAFDRHGDAAAARAEYRRAVEWNPDFLPALDTLAWKLILDPESDKRARAEAAKFAQHAVDLTESRQPTYLTTLAAAYAAQGDFDQAQATAATALGLAHQMRAQGLATQIAGHLEQYRQQRPLTKP